MANFLDKLRDQQKMIKSQLAQVGESLDNMNATMKTETAELRQNVAKMAALTPPGTTPTTEYTVGRTHINSRLKMTQGQLSDSEDQLFAALQKFLNSMHEGRLHINDEMIEKAKKLYRKGQKDNDAVDGNEKKKVESFELQSAENDIQMKLDLDDFMEDLILESDDIEVTLTVPKDETDYTSALAQYESDLLEHENRAQS